jgi:hypothetical protein
MRGSIRNASIAMDPAHSSYASSNNIPIGIPGYYVQDRGSARSLPFEHVGRPSVDRGRPSIEHGRPSTDRARLVESYDDHPIEPPPPVPEDRYEGNESPSPEPGALIRQASLGKRTKPTITTVKSSERARKDSSTYTPPSPPRDNQRIPQQPLPPLPTELEKDAYVSNRPRSVSSVSSYGDDEKAVEAGAVVSVGATAAALAVPRFARRDQPPPGRTTRSPESILSSGTGLIDPSDSESDDNPSRPKKRPSNPSLLTAALPKEQLNRSQPRSPLAPPSPNDPVIGKRPSLTPSATDLPLPGAGLSSKDSKRRPPRLNVDAVRDAEARGSLTSLPDLIRRATKLASNLDRGKTASRLGMNFFIADGEPNSSSQGRESGSGSISDILASFPPPSGLRETPPGTRGAALSRWSSGLRHEQLGSDSDVGASRKKKGRRCCGMPLWLFMLLLIVVVLLVAAAVIVPVMLLVVVPANNEKDASGAGVSAAEVQSCRDHLQCANGGANILSSDGYCRCVCANGFTGRTCSTRSDAACTTISVGDTSDATVGDDIPRLLNGAQTNFGIPLDGENVLGLFSSADMSCSAENALVTFSNVRRRTVVAPTPVRRDPAPATTHGILYESGSPASSASNAQATSSASGQITSAKTLDFARTAILFIFTDSSSPTMAVTAQESLQSYFATGQTTNGRPINPSNVTLGNGYTCDLQALTLSLGNGTVVGGSQ